MSDEDALLAAIAASPDDDTPRLAYADWLEEHDRPVRAEFVRVQVEVARKETLPRALQNRHLALWERNQELLDRHRAELLGPLAGLPGDVTVEFRRGFVAGVTLGVHRFVRHAAALAAARPRPKVRVTGVASSPLAFLSCPHLDCVTGLGLYSEDPDVGLIGDPGEALAGLTRLRSMESLDLGGCGLGDWGGGLIGLLPASFPFPALADLDLSNNLLGDGAVSALLGTPLPRQLRQLVLAGNPITDDGAEALAGGWPAGDADKLQQLDLRLTNIGRRGHQALLPRFGGRVELF